MMLTLAQLKHVVALETHRSFTRAADAVGITQSALTQSVLKLEAAYEVPLFTRKHGTVEPTAFGLLLIDVAKQTLGKLANFDREVHLLKNLKAGRIIIGCDSLVAEALLGPALARMMHDYPAIQFATSFESWDMLRDDLLEKKIDIYIGSPLDRPDRRIRTLEFALPPLMTVCRPGHPLAERQNVTLRDCLDYPIAGPPPPSWYFEWFCQHVPNGAETFEQFHPYALVSSDFGLLRSIIRHTEAIGSALPSLLEEDIASGALHALDVEGFDRPLPAIVATLAEKPQVPAMGALVREILFQADQLIRPA